MQQQKITDDLELMINVLAAQHCRGGASERIEAINCSKSCSTWGGCPKRAYTDSEVTLCDSEVTPAEIEYVVSRISDVRRG